MTDVNLFDPTPFIDEDRKPRKARKPKADAPEVIASDGTWVVMARVDKPPHDRVHLLDLVKSKASGADITLCDLAGRSISVAFGSKVHPCPKCQVVAAKPPEAPKPRQRGRK